MQVNYGSISGTIFNEFDTPLAGAIVSLRNSTELKYTTIKDGGYFFENVATGTYEISIWRDEFIGTTKEITIEKDKNVVHDFILKVGKPYLDIYFSSSNISSEGRPQNFTIASNTGWVVSTDVSWIKLPKTTGNNLSPFIFEPLENTSGKSRSAKITVIAGDIIKEISVIQDYALELIEASLSTPLNDSITLSFNKQVDVSFIRALYTNCLTTIGYRYMENATKIRFRYTCGILGRSYPFSIDIKDKYRSYTKPFSINYFTNKILINDNGITTPRTFITKDNKYLWFASYRGNTLRKISIADFKVEQAYNFNFRITNLSYNPYNKLIYLLTDQPDIYLINPDDGKIVKHIKVESSIPGDIYPLIYPVDLEFTVSGIGVMVCNSNITSGSTWKVIDSKQNDRIYSHEQSNKFNSIDEDGVKANYNYTKLYISEGYGKRVFSFDPVTNVIKDIDIQYGFGSAFSTNRLNNNMLVFSPMHFIFNPETYEKKTTGLNTLGFGPRGEFSYVDGEEDIVYYVDEDRFTVFDYKNKKINISFPAYNPYSLFQPRATTDGKYLILFLDGALYRYSTATFN